MTGSKEILREIIDGGALGAAVMRAGPLPESYGGQLERWLGKGYHAGMEWIGSHRLLRMTPESILSGAESIITVAFGYNFPSPRPGDLPMMARYAAGKDYHTVLRAALEEALKNLRERDERLAEHSFRICIDTAPVAERFLAAASGLCTPGRNGFAILPGYGAGILLAEIYTTLVMEPAIMRVSGHSLAASSSCLECGRCLAACPTGALQSDSSVDTRRCLSYLTIEHRGEWISPEALTAMHTPEGRRTLYGCDRCLDVCPMNSIPDKDSTIGALRPLPYYAVLTPESAAAMTQEEYAATFRGTAIKRAKLSGLRRNALNIISDSPHSRQETN